ncbi:MAG: TonB-dependent receptor plug domain-containing protein [Bacteroidales bacterium]|nr:TonB-dependent receptor plug domain-containing protein [Bacteroidales bacterium]
MKRKHFSKSKMVYFKQYSRKKYAAFNSLGKIIKISALCASCSLIICPLQGQAKGDTDTISKTLDLEEVEIVGQKSTLLIDEVPRMVELIPAQVIQNSPSQSFTDLLEVRSNIDIRPRGPFGAQADVSIRGGSFDHTVILLNGTNLSNPQTGHHSLNLPLDQETISKIEVLNGPSARAIGANAYTGAINIIARPSGANKATASLHIGDYGFLREHIAIDFVVKNSSHLVTAGQAQTNGYCHNTDFYTHHVFYHGIYKLNPSTMAFLQMGYNQKSFGANSYYTPKFPDQFEWNKSFFFNAGIVSGRQVKTRAQVYFHRHSDRFELFREGKGYYNYNLSGNLINTVGDTAPQWYKNHNYHLTDVYGAETNVTAKSALGKTTFGASLRSENILSNQLGSMLAVEIPIKENSSLFYDRQASRNNFEIFAEHSYTNSFLFVSAGTMLNHNTFAPDKLYVIPGADINLKLTRQLSILGSYNYTIGMPTFTDLNYQGPANQGNNSLLPYTQHSFETAIAWNFQALKMKSAVFYTLGKNNIEWAMNDTSFKFMPINVELSKNQGFEFSLNYSPESSNRFNRVLNNLFVGYTFIGTYRETPDALTKYSNIRQKFVVNIQQKLVSGLLLSWNFMFKERTGYFLTYDFDRDTYLANNYKNIYLVDLRISYTIRNIGLYIEGSNLTNALYYESGSIPQPGRWLRGGVSVKITGKD